MSDDDFNKAQFTEDARYLERMMSPHYLQHDEGELLEALGEALAKATDGDQDAGHHVVCEVFSELIGDDMTEMAHGPMSGGAGRQMMAYKMKKQAEKEEGEKKKKGKGKKKHQSYHEDAVKRVLSRVFEDWFREA